MNNVPLSLTYAGSAVFLLQITYGTFKDKIKASAPHYLARLYSSCAPRLNVPRCMGQRKPFPTFGDANFARTRGSELAMQINEYLETHLEIFQTIFLANFKDEENCYGILIFFQSTTICRSITVPKVVRESA